ncbi:activating signal cointegrator 1 complex subunit 1 isoform X2 [Plodia interpunctella]|nr:activating signal cointegrator 1 complex subunit 1 isoform X2 [Plodia interpunctella]XP_053614755.1 activating signal cointegrator 1 complex subunit 1 isoform X2 [Plodia interpunctella]XP_053614838.1 activating signal cointegrator 1 complex subunit 1 isoform X2 [Plodia interpunctella]XP_053614919.1 activating signal cointegrator 1 complex subunit 1 isoform X2 [Plodia interpunctella]XP_053615003.1 activating signal cointegrator 1 complex subunit 1 isoform X2 [Plodia interpunctella]
MGDILKPELIWVEGRCYRVNDPTTEITAFQEHDLYENETTMNIPEDEHEEEGFEVKQIDNDRYTTSLHVSKHYIGYIIGKKGAMRSRIERDTRTDIKIPRQGQTGDITIFGSSVANVKAARKRINTIVMSMRMKQRSTHFISIPVNGQLVMKNFEKFKEEVLKRCSMCRGVEDSLFIKGSKLHVTVGVMCLMDNEERLHASKLFTEAKEKIVMPLVRDYLPLKIRLKGLSYMNDDPKEICVLYCNVHEEDAPPGLLQSLTDSLVDYFYKAEFMRREEFGRDKVKMHVTLLNSKYIDRSSEVQSGDVRNFRKPRITFDGSEILEMFSDYDFGVTELTDIHLSQMHTMGSDGYYQSTCVISLK